MEKKLYELQKIVKEILEHDPKARDDDMYLYITYVKHQMGNQDYSFELIFANKEYRINHNIRTFSGVERCRRKMQEKYPELTNDYHKKIRGEEQKIYEEYAKS